MRRVRTSIISQLDELGVRVQAHKRATPTPAMSTRTYDDMEAPGHSLAHLQVCAKGLRDAIVGGFSKGIKVAKIALENAQEDFKTTVTRTGEAARWKHGVANSWLEKGKEICGTLLEEAVEAFREAEREGAKTRIRLMESNCEELEDLADKVKKQAVSETEPEPLIELGEEIEYKRDNVVNLAQMLKENMPNEFKERALQDSAKMAKDGQRKLCDLRACLEFCSFDSEASSYSGPAPSAAEAVPESRPLWNFRGGGPESGQLVFATVTAGAGPGR
jgi:hypothetical protein